MEFIDKCGHSSESEVESDGNISDVSVSGVKRKISFINDSDTESDEELYVNPYILKKKGRFDDIVKSIERKRQIEVGDVVSECNKIVKSEYVTAPENLITEPIVIDSDTSSSDGKEVTFHPIYKEIVYIIEDGNKLIPAPTTIIKNFNGMPYEKLCMYEHKQWMKFYRLYDHNVAWFYSLGM